MSSRQSHPGWLLDHPVSSGYCMPRFAKNHSDDSKRGENIGLLIEHAATQKPCPLYLHAFKRWEQIVNNENFSVWKAQVSRRLFLACSETSVIDASVRLHYTYGTPLIAGSMLKGIALAYASSVAGKECLAPLIEYVLECNTNKTENFTTEHAYTTTLDYLFGANTSTNETDSGAGGYLRFHDAWWIYDSAETPLVAEIITPHHADYYQSQGATPPRDTDSPVPVPQIAVRGAFLFAVEGPKPWADWGLELLRHALCSEGAGNRRHLDYGFFEPLKPAK